MELRHLRYFVTLAEELHFGRAAARLHMAQPPLSQQIKALEAEVGALLFQRTRRHVELTEAGRAFLPEATATLEQARRAENVVRDAQAGKQGRLSVGFVTSACHTVLPAALRGFRAAHPGVELDLREMNPAQQLAALDRREIDLGLLRPPIGQCGVQTEVVLSEPLAVALPARHALAGRPQLRLVHLRAEPFILFPRRHGPGLFDITLEACRKAGFTPTVPYEPDSMQSLLAYVAGGLGVALVPASLARMHPAEITFRTLVPAGACLDLLAMWSSGREATLIQHFRAQLRQAGVSCLKRIRNRRPRPAG